MSEPPAAGESLLTRLNPLRTLALNRKQWKCLLVGWAVLPAITVFCAIKVTELAVLAMNGTPTGHTSAGDYLAAWAVTTALYPKTMQILIRWTQPGEEDEATGDDETGAAGESPGQGD